MIPTSWSFTLKAAVPLLACLLLVVPSPSSGADKGQFVISGSGGQVGLLNDPGREGANGLGLALGAGYRLDNNLELEMQYLLSSHSAVDHRSLDVGALYYFSDYENAWPHLSVGMSFISNKFKNGGITGDAAALYVGGGLFFELSRNVTLGPEVRYQKAFESRGRVNEQDVTTVGDSYTVLLRLNFYLGGAG